MESKPNEETFFSQLRKLAATIDKQVPALQKQTTETSQNSELCQLSARKTISDMKTEIKTVKVDVQTETKKVQGGTKVMEEVLTCFDSYLSKSETSLSQIEEYLKQYGYTPPANEAVKPQKKTETGKEEVKEEKSMEETENALPPVSKTVTNGPPPAEDGSHTPKLEGRGLSNFTLEILKSANKKPVANAPAPTVDQRKPLPSIPEYFQHDGIMVTPSLLGGRSCPDESIHGYDLHAALASPVPPVLETPGIKQIQKNPEIFPEPKVNLPFDKNSSDSPAVPVFQTPGIKQIAMVAPCQSHGERKKAVVGLFKEEGVTGIKQEPVAPRLNTTYMIEEPQPPDLTYNLEDISEMTGVYSIVQKIPKAPEPLAERLLADKQNNTPPTPELLSERLSKLAKEKGNNSNAPVQKRTMYGDMPPPPKLFGNYSFTNRENKPPS